MKRNKKIYWELFTSFLKVGAFTFGGGYAMIPLIQKEAVENNHWISESDILDVIAIAESTPGPIAVNSATFVGYRVAGFWGSFFSTLGVALPSFSVILLISFFYEEFRSNQWIGYAFLGIRAGVAVLLINAFLKLYKTLKVNVFNIAVIVLSLAAVLFFDVSSILVIAAAGVLGVIYNLLRNKDRFGEQQR